MNKLTPFACWLYVFFIPTAMANETPPNSIVKEQVLSLLDMIEDRNKLINEKMFGETPSDVNQSQVTNINEAQTPVPIANINPSSNAFVNGIRDPFAVTQEIAVLNQASQASQATQGPYASHNFRSSNLAFNLPKLTMKGVVFKAQEKLPIALLEIGGIGVYMVRVGDEFSFNPAIPTQVIKVIKISRLNVVVEVGTLGDLIVVR
jgi:Tfp pilus assembly protein PilP